MNPRLLALLHDNDSYEKNRDFVQSFTTDGHGRYVLNQLREQHGRAEDISLTRILEDLQADLGTYRDDTALKVRISLVQRAIEISNSETSTSATLAALNYQFKQQLETILIGDMPGTMSTEVFRETAKLVDKYQHLWNLANGSSDKELTIRPDMLAAEAPDEGFTWHMRKLTDALGRLRKGNLIVFGARPETGKTTFLVNTAVNVAKQLPKKDKRKILWINNEEPGQRVFFRIALATMNAHCLKDDGYWKPHSVAVSAGALSDPHRAEDYVVSVSKILGKRRIVMLDKSDASVSDVDNFISRHDPALIIFDQLWKVITPLGKSEDVTTQTYLYRWARSISKTKAPVITAHQTDAEATNVLFPSLSNLYMSKTAVQGEADAVIMMGANTEGMRSGYRKLSIVKNKIGQGTDRYPMINARVEGNLALIGMTEDYPATTVAGEPEI